MPDIPEHFLQGTGKMLFVRAPKKLPCDLCCIMALGCALQIVLWEDSIVLWEDFIVLLARLHCDQSTDLNLIYMQPRNECGMKSSHGAATEWTSHGARPQISTNLTYCFSKTSRAGFARTPECVPTRCPLCLPFFLVFILETTEVAVVV